MLAVVADEVRKLAETSANSAGKIATIIEKIQKGTKEAVGESQVTKDKVTSGLDAVNQAGHSFEDIEEAIRSVTQHKSLKFLPQPNNYRLVRIK